MITIPDQTNKKWIKANNSDVFGNVYETKNISFDEEGYLKLALSPRATINENTTNWDRPAVIIYNGDKSKYFAQTWDEPFDIEREILAELPVEDTSTDNPSGTTAADADWFDNKLVVSEASDINYYDAATNAWVDTNATLTNAIRAQHIVANFLSKACIAVADVNTVKLFSAMSATPTLLATLTIPADFQITSMKYFNQNLYIGTRHNQGGRASVYVWNGEGTAAQSVYPTESNIIHDMCPFDGSMVILPSDGGLYRFTGSGFSLLDAFPIYFTENVLVDDSNVNMYHNVLKAVGDLLYISFSDNDNNFAFDLDQPAGVWCYDRRLGFLYHKYSFSNSITYKLADPAIDTTTNAFVVAQNIVTGTEVWYKASTANSALADDTKYFAIRVDATHVKIATTKANAVAGTNIDFTLDDGVGEDWTFFPNIDYGQIMSDRPSAIQTIDFSQSKPEYGTEIIWSSDVSMRDSISGNQNHLGSVSSGVESRGYFTTPKIFSSQITDTFNQFVLKFFPLRNELDKIIVKYRVVNELFDSIKVNNTALWVITWTSATTFTTTQAEWANAVVGHEVNVLRGAAGGLLAHITDISVNTGTYTVTIDESYDNYASGDISTAVFKNWKKFATIAYGDAEATAGLFTKSFNKAIGKFIQIKIELRGIEVKLEELDVDNIYKLPSKKSKS